MKRILFLLLLINLLLPAQISFAAGAEQSSFAKAPADRHTEKKSFLARRWAEVTAGVIGAAGAAATIVCALKKHAVSKVRSAIKIQRNTNILSPLRKMREKEMKRYREAFTWPENLWNQNPKVTERIRKNKLSRYRVNIPCLVEQVLTPNEIVNHSVRESLGREILNRSLSDNPRQELAHLFISTGCGLQEERINTLLNMEAIQRYREMAQEDQRYRTRDGELSRLFSANRISERFWRKWMFIGTIVTGSALIYFAHKWIKKYKEERDRKVEQLKTTQAA